MLRLALLPALFLILSLQLHAVPMCIAGGTLASYELLGATGCTIGIETVENFTFTPVSTGATDPGITVTYTSGMNSNGSYYGVIFSGIDTTENYLIGYNWDSLPIRGMGDVLDPGTVDVSTGGCPGVALYSSSCPGGVSVAVNFSSTTAFVAFPPISLV